MIYFASWSHHSSLRFSLSSLYFFLYLYFIFLTLAPFSSFLSIWILLEPPRSSLSDFAAHLFSVAAAGSGEAGCPPLDGAEALKCELRGTVRALTALGRYNPTQG